jgi:transcriptional regulator with XRE-family HTH domain
MELIPKGWGSQLRSERKRLGHTQADVASLVGISTVTYQQYEREDHEPKLAFLNKLNELGFDVRSIFFGEANKAKVIPAHSQQLEMRAFKLAQEYVNKTYADELGDEGRFALFEFFRSQLEDLIVDGAEMPSNLDAFNKNPLSFFLQSDSMGAPQGS